MTAPSLSPTPLPLPLQAAIDKGVIASELQSGWVHQLDPFLWQISGEVGLRWYGLAYLFGFICGYFLMRLMARRGRGGLPEPLIADYIVAIVLGTMIGGRVGYAVFYSRDLLTDFSSSFPFWGVLRVWEGGMASHGGMIGITLAAVWFARRHKLDWMNLGDLATLGGSIGVAAGRVANFMNGELYGRPVESAVSWAVKFPSELFLWMKHDLGKSLTSQDPDLLPRLSDVVTHVGVSAAQWGDWTSRLRSSQSARIEIQNTIYRIIEGSQNGNEALVQALQQVLTARHPSQLYAGALEGILTFAVAMMFWRKPRKPGVVGGVWVITYAIVRIINESWRMPDAHIGLSQLGLSRGQEISFFMLFIGVAILIYALKRPAEKVGGWASSANQG